MLYIRKLYDFFLKWTIYIVNKLDFIIWYFTNLVTNLHNSKVESIQIYNIIYT